MKKLIYGVLFLAVVGIGIVGCEKESISTNQQDEIVASLDEEPNTIKSNGPIITIKGKPYRATTNRPRDGKNCGCKSCFGLCDLSIEGEWDFRTILIKPNVALGKSRIYFTENLSNFEREFGIDKNLSVPNEALERSSINSLILKKGIYDFIEESGEVLVKNELHTTYGYVDVNSQLK